MPNHQLVYILLVWMIWMVYAAPPPPPPPEASPFPGGSPPPGRGLRLKLGNWSVVHEKICSLDDSKTKDMSTKIDECNKKSHFYEIEQLMRKCHDTMKSASSYLDGMRNICKLQDCIDKVNESPQFKLIMDNIHSMDQAERQAKNMERLACMREVLGVTS